MLFKPMTPMAPTIIGDEITSNALISLSKMSFTFTPIDFISDWQRCSETADYLAHFQSGNFTQPAHMVSIPSTVMNELIENTIKFSYDAVEEIKLNIYNYSHFIGIETTNLANQHNVDALKKILESINTSELEAQFCHYINSHTHDQDFKSQLGLLCLKKDYDARITAKVTQDIDREHLYRVSINVNIPIEPT